MLNALTEGPWHEHVPRLLVSHLHVYSTVARDGLSIVTLSRLTNFHSDETAYSSLPSLFSTSLPCQLRQKCFSLGSAKQAFSVRVSLPVFR